MVDIQKKFDDAKANYQRIETTIMKKQQELEQLEKQLLVAQGRKEALEGLLSESAK